MIDIQKLAAEIKAEVESLGSASEAHGADCIVRLLANALRDAGLAERSAFLAACAPNA